MKHDHGYTVLNDGRAQSMITVGELFLLVGFATVGVTLALFIVEGP